MKNQNLLGEEYKSFEKRINKIHKKKMEAITHKKRNNCIMAVAFVGAYLVFSVFGMAYMDSVHNEELNELKWYLKHAQSEKIQERYDILKNRLESNKGITGYLTAGAKTIYWYNPLFGTENPLSLRYKGR